MGSGDGVEPRRDRGLARSPVRGTRPGLVDHVRDLMGRQGTWRGPKGLDDGVDVCHTSPSCAGRVRQWLGAVPAARVWAAPHRLPFTAYDATSCQGVQESEVVKAGHRPRLQMVVTDAWLHVAAIILRLEKRPAPRGTGLTGSRGGARATRRVPPWVPFPRLSLLTGAVVSATVAAVVGPFAEHGEDAARPAAEPLHEAPYPSHRCPLVRLPRPPVHQRRCSDHLAGGNAQAAASAGWVTERGPGPSPRRGP